MLFVIISIKDRFFSRHDNFKDQPVKLSDRFRDFELAGDGLVHNEW